MQTLDHIYEVNRNEAYTTLISHLPFRLSHNVTPLSLADDAECMRVIGHPCAQTLLILIWMNHVNIDIHWFKLCPIFTLLPFIILPFVTINADSLSFADYRQTKLSPDADDTQEDDDRKRTLSVSQEPGNFLYF